VIGFFTVIGMVLALKQGMMIGFRIVLPRQGQGQRAYAPRLSHAGVILKLGETELRDPTTQCIADVVERTSHTACVGDCPSTAELASKSRRDSPRAIALIRMTSYFFSYVLCGFSASSGIKSS
jgi:hypothetical protein